MKIQTIKNVITDAYGYAFKHIIRIGKNKTSEVVSMNGQPMQKTVLKNGKVRIFDITNDRLFLPFYCITFI